MTSDVFPSAPALFEGSLHDVLGHLMIAGEYEGIPRQSAPASSDETPKDYFGRLGAPLAARFGVLPMTPFAGTEVSLSTESVHLPLPMVEAVTEEPALVAVAHGTRSPAGRRAMAQLRLAIEAARPSLQVVPAYVDVHKPALADVVDRLRAQHRSMIVLPLLLSAGFHLRVDIGDAVASADGLAAAAGPLGPDPILARVLNQRLAQAGAGSGDVIVLAAAGSSDPATAGQVEDMAQRLSMLRGAPVLPAYLSAARPDVPTAVHQARLTSRAVSIATYLLAPGHLWSKLADAGADHVAEPLGPHPDIAELALRRYDEALA